jgi:hypothetical protein
LIYKSRSNRNKLEKQTLPKTIIMDGKESSFPNKPETPKRKTAK